MFGRPAMEGQGPFTPSSDSRTGITSSRSAIDGRDDSQPFSD